MCELKLKIFLNIPKIFLKENFTFRRWTVFMASSDEHPVVSRNRTKFLINFLNLYFHKVTPPKSENHFTIKDYWLANFILIWPLVRRLVILTEKQCTWRGTNLMQQILSLSHICQMLLILVQSVWLIFWSPICVHQQAALLHYMHAASNSLWSLAS